MASYTPKVVPNEVNCYRATCHSTSLRRRLGQPSVHCLIVFSEFVFVYGSLQQPAYRHSLGQESKIARS